MKKFKAFLKNISIILSFLFFIIIIALVLLSVRAKKEEKLFSLFGYSYSLVVSPSMEEAIKVGDLLLIKQLDYEKYLKEAEEEKDIIVYASKKKVFIVHRLKEITAEGLILKGDNNPDVDEELVTNDNFVGIVRANGLNFIGRLLIGNKMMIFFVFIVFLVYVIVTESINIALKKKPKKAEISAALRAELKEELLKEIKKELKDEK